MKQIILGTAGHIDHGKTSLIRALTGIDTDRLKEEKRRGITIELGFAYLDLPSGQRIGIVDVPGHEKFVKNMVAGATGIDIVAMIIAADEGIMPQTREHMEICSLLDIKQGFVVLTKVDLVDEEWLELVLEDIREFTQGTFLEDAPVLPVSSVTGQGIPDFIEALDKLSTVVPARTPSGLFRLPVDRVFTMKGFGTVITGTVASGHIRTGDTIMVYPSRITSKVRGIQVHNQSINKAAAGMRTAINFQGLEKASVKRGDVLAIPDTLKPSYMLDITVNFLKSNEKPLKNRTLVRFHTGTNEVLGNLILLDQEELNPGETNIAQLRLESPIVCVKDDKYVIRSYSPIRTIGGGKILNPIPSKHKRFRSEVIEGLKDLVTHEAEAIISFHVDQSGPQGVSFNDLKLMTNIAEKPLDKILQGLLSQKTLTQIDRENRILIHKYTFEKLAEQASDFLEDYHKINPLKTGMPTEELKSKFPPSLSTKVFTHLLGRMIKDEKIIQEEDIVRLTGHKVSLAIDQINLKKNIQTAYQKSGLMPPYFKELSKTLGIDPLQAKDVLMLLVEQSQITKVKEDLYFHTEAINDLKQRLIEHLKANQEITTPQFKALTGGASRKYVIPLLEYFDAGKVTLRVGDIRKLRKVS